MSFKNQSRNTFQLEISAREKFNVRSILIAYSSLYIDDFEKHDNRFPIINIYKCTHSNISPERKKHPATPLLIDYNPISIRVFRTKSQKNPIVDEHHVRETRDVHRRRRRRETRATSILDAVPLTERGGPGCRRGGVSIQLVRERTTG